MNKPGTTDEGGIKIGITTDPSGNVRMDFGKPVTWMEFSPEGAIEVAQVLLRHAKPPPLPVEDDPGEPPMLSTGDETTDDDPGETEK